MSSNGETERPLGPREFTEEIAERLERLPGIERVTRGNLTLQIVLHGRQLLVELGHFYNIYRRQPDQFPAIVQSLLGSVQAEAPERVTVPFERIKERIFPMLKPIAILAEVAERQLPMLTYRSFFADLIVTYVIDEGRSVIYVNDEHLAAWGAREATIYQHALDNLRRKTIQPEVCTVVGDGARRLMMYSTGDGFDAARLLLTDILQEWQEHLPGRLVVGVPNRDFLIGFSDADPQVLRQVAQQVAVDATHREYGLTDQLFTVLDGRIELYEYNTSGDQR